MALLTNPLMTGFDQGVDAPPRWNGFVPDDARGPLTVGDPTDPASLAGTQVGVDAARDIVEQTYAKIQAAQQQAADQGQWTGGQVWEGGHPTGAGLLDAIGQMGTAVALGTGSGGDAPAGGLFLDRFDPRTGRKMVDPDLTVPGNHAYFVRNPAGEHLGTVETEWDPNVGDLNIANVQSNEGANSFGPAAVKQLRDALLDQYPDARTLSGYRVTGANPNREIFQRVQSDQGNP